MMPDAGAQTDSLYMSIDSLTFVSQKHTSMLSIGRDDVMKVDMKLMQSLPKILGNTDPVSFIRNLPGVQTNSEYDSGIHIQGCDNAHNEISIGGVPVYGINHLFGFFSIFNPSHFSGMKFSRSASSNRIGGMIEMELPDTLDRKTSGDICVGIMSSQGSLGVKTGRNSHLRLSARGSYMNLLYGRWLLIGDSPIRYSFGDGNLTWFYSCGRHRLWVDAYWGMDKAMVSENTFKLNLGAGWGNSIAAVHYEHKGDVLTQKHSVYYSGFHTDGNIQQDKSTLTLDSGISSYGYKGVFKAGGFTGGSDIIWYDVMPQHPVTKGLYGPATSTGEKQRALEASLKAGYTLNFTDRWSLEAGARGTCYISPEKRCYWDISPKATLEYNGYHIGRFSATYGWNNQYIFQTGLSNIGLPIEFWFMAGRHSAPQRAQHASLSYDAEFFRNAVAVSASVYLKQLHNQVEYRGDFFDFFNSVYNMEDYLLKGKGWNYGMNIMVHKQSGNLTGWISWSFGRALRKFDHPDYPGIYPASHERLHEINAVCTYKTGKWDFSGTFVYASGAPFTAPESFYLSSGQILTLFGEYNSCRMRPYIRLDLSASYAFRRTERQENGINISIYNVLCRQNDVMYRLRLIDGTYSYRPLAFFLRFVPSISYYHKF